MLDDFLVSIRNTIWQWDLKKWRWCDFIWLHWMSRICNNVRKHRWAPAACVLYEWIMYVSSSWWYLVWPQFVARLVPKIKNPQVVLIILLSSVFVVLGIAWLMRHASFFLKQGIRTFSFIYGEKSMIFFITKEEMRVLLWLRIHTHCFQLPVDVAMHFPLHI